MPHGPNTFVIKIENKNGKIIRTYKKSDASGGYIAGVGRPVNIIEFDQKELLASDWKNIEKKIEEANFWELCTHGGGVIELEDGTDELLIISGGAYYITEILWDNHYHLVYRVEAFEYYEKSYAELCKLIERTYFK